MGEMSYDQEVVSLPAAGARTAKLALQAELAAAKSAGRAATWLTSKFLRVAPIPFTDDGNQVDVNAEHVSELGISDERRDATTAALDSLGREVTRNHPLGVNRAAGDIVYITRQEMPDADPQARANRFTRLVTEAVVTPEISPRQAEHMLGLQDPQRLLGA